MCYRGFVPGGGNSGKNIYRLFGFFVVFNKISDIKGFKFVQKLVIKIEELPVRGHKLSVDDYTKVFGGCEGFGDRCNIKTPCCPEYTCTYVRSWAMANLCY